MFKFYPAVFAYYCLLPTFIVVQVLFIGGYIDFQIQGGLTLLAVICIPLLAIKSATGFKLEKKVAPAFWLRLVFFSYITIFLLMWFGMMHMSE